MLISTELRDRKDCYRLHLKLTYRTGTANIIIPIETEACFDKQPYCYYEKRDWYSRHEQVSEKVSTLATELFPHLEFVNFEIVSYELIDQSDELLEDD